ncbi:sugar-binding transcriptional regulator [Aurantimonas sp. VKM B-3413]|uniref:sugar-binding transcriptional regulator n=1 Tax=Aurantimonas sp. VKM B-3413 TaxID=2779401 RepID=UPI001E3ECD12|nr:sugar-binding transcriptional regulator [Aurantimonas sp. VKM B-3413]MCB8836397.1 sugar-binding transcriptional regulator [Aurantimonas sp. VKM B-3413]
MNAEASLPRLETDEASLSARAAWLYFSAGMTQGQIAKRLGVANTKAHRLIARASREGLIRVFVDAEVASCIQLEDELAGRFGLGFCQVAPDLAETGLPLKALGLAGATFLKNEVERGEHALIGIGHGRTLAAAVNAMPQVASHKTRFVSVLGGFNRRFAANPYDVIHRLAERTGAEAYQIPLPLFANTAEDKAVLLSQPGVGEVFDLACSATLVVAGIGSVTEEASLLSNRMIGPEEMTLLRESGAVGELLGHYFDPRGMVVAESFSQRALAPGIEHLKASTVVAIAGGREKIEPVMALLRSGVLNGLVVDEMTADAIARETASD